MKDAEIQTGPSAKSEDGTIDSPVELGAVDGGDAAATADGGERTDGSRTSADGGSAGTAVDAASVVEAEVQRQRERVERLLEEDGINHAHVRDDIQETMTANVNVFRREENLKDALEDIREARERYQHVAASDPSRTYNTDLMHTMETRNIIDVAEAITTGALAREEFRGAHWREQYQYRDDENWLKHTLLAWNGGNPELYYKDVILEGEDKVYEPKERSY
jgi:succinate dehydrogenase / fumarate reductase flavoprotein subunit